MKVKIQYLFFLKLMTVVAVASLLLAGVHRFQLHRNALQILAKARSARESDKLGDAIRFYNQFLVLRRDSAEAQVELGDLLLKVGKLDGAFLAYESALRIDPKLLGARKSMVKISIDLGRHAEAQKILASEFLPSDPDNAENHWLMGICENRLGEFARAEKHFALAFKLETGNPAYASSLAELLRDRFDGAVRGREILDELVKNAPENSDAFLARGRYLLKQGRSLASSEKGPRDAILDSAWQDGLEANRLVPNTPKNVSFLVFVAVLRNRISEIREIVRSTIQAHPQAPELYESAAQIELTAKQPEAAVQILRDGLKANPGNPDLLFNVAQLQLEGGRISEAEELIATLKVSKTSEAPTRFLEAKLLASKGQWLQAVTLLEQSRGIFDRRKELLKQADFLIALCYRNLGNPDQEIEALQRAIGADPLWLAARESLANAFLRTGRIQESIKEFSLILDQPNATLSAGLSLARLLFIDGLGRNTSGEAWDPLRQLLARFDGYPEAANDLAIMRAELLVVENEAEEAEAILKSRLELEPTVPELHQALISLQIRNKAWDEAERSLDTAEKSLKDAVTVRLERGRYLIRRFDKQVDMEKLDQLAVPDADWDSNQKFRLASGFAGYFLALEDYERSMIFAKKVATSELGQSNLSSHLLIFELALRSNDATAMAESLAQVKSIEGVGPFWRLGEAVRLMLEASNLAASNPGSQAAAVDALYSKAVEQLSEAAVQRPNWSRIYRLKGDIGDRQDKPDVAIKNYLEAIRLGEQSPRLVSRAISLMFVKGRFSEADEVVRKLQEQKTPFSSELTRVATQVSMELENFDRALSLAKDWASQSGKQEDHLFLAGVYTRSGNLTKAQEELRTTIDRDRAAAGPWVALVQLLAQMGNRDKALEAIDEAASAIREEDRDNALAQAYQAIEDYVNAAQYYRKAVEAQPDDFELLVRYADFCLRTGQEATAEPILEMLVSEKSNATEELQSSARRALAMIVGLRGSDENIKKSRDLLAINTKKGGPTIPDQRMLAFVLSNRLDKPSITESISLLEQIAKSEPKFSLTDNFLLANLYLRSGDTEVNWARYRGKMLEVFGNGGVTNSQYVRSYAEQLFKKKEIEESALWVNTLKKLAPKDLSTASIEAQLLFRTRDYDRLLKLVESNRSQAEPERLLWTAQMAESGGNQMVRLGKTKNAKQFLDIARESYAKIAKVDPKRTLAVASYLARIGEIKESIEMLRGSELPPDEVGELIQGVLQTGSLKEVDARELIGLVQTVQAKHPKNVIVNLGLGDLWSWLRVESEAASAYQMALEVEPNNVSVLNNLAMLLALTGPKLTEANEFIDQAVKVAGPMDYLLDTRGIVRFASGNIEGAEKDILKAIEVSPRPDRFFHLAQVLTSQGRTEDARAAMKKAKDGGVTAEVLHPLERKAFESLSQ